MAETMFNDTIKDTLEKADPLEIHVKTVTMRVESLATTDAFCLKDARQPSTKSPEPLERDGGQQPITHRKPPEFPCRNALEMSFSALPSVPNS